MKNCWIVGASCGIGEALAHKLWAENWNLIISSRDFEKLQLVERNLRQENQSDLAKILCVKLDVSDVDSLAAAFEEIAKNFEKIDLVIFCSGLYQPMLAADFDLELSKKIIDVNLCGFLNLLHFVVPKMLAQKFGHIAVISSVAGYLGLPKSFAYGASKAGLINLCEGIYLELKRKNIALSLINPGFVESRLTKKNDFFMPFIISTKEAAEQIYQGLQRKDFEIHFPKKFTFFLKFLRLLPYKIFFFLTKKIS